MEKNLIKNIDVSILIVNYNNFDLLFECLSSIIKQTLNLNYEIIVVDNASIEDGTSKIQDQFKDIILIKNERNIGFAKANNLGATYAKGKYLLILNNDTLFLENTIKKIFDYSESLNTSALVGCRLKNIDGSIQSSTFQFPSSFNVFSSNLFLYKIFPTSKKINKDYISYLKTENPIDTDVVIGAFMFMKREDFNRLGGFDERFFFYHEDSDLCKRFKNSIGRIIYYPGSSIIHYGGAAAKNTLWFHYKNRSIALIKFLQKHTNYPEKILALFYHYFGILIRIPLFIVIAILTLNSKLVIRSYYYLKLLFIYPKNEFIK